MEEEKEAAKLLNAAYRYLGYRARTKKEMLSYLEEKCTKYTIPQKAVGQVIKNLEDLGYINDQSFVEQYITSRSHSKPKGRYALTIELLQKGIEQEVIDVYFDKITLDEDALAHTSLQKKWASLQRHPPNIRRRKATDFLRRRGFPYDIIKKTIEELEVEE